MAVRVLRLGTPRVQGEGIRVGTVRKPPRGVPKEKFAALDYFDVWFPNLSPSTELMKWARSQPMTPERWKAFARRFRAEMSTPESRHALGLLAALSHQTDFSVGCYCEDEHHCHRSVLRDLLEEHGARLA